MLKTLKKNMQNNLENVYPLKTKYMNLRRCGMSLKHIKEATIRNYLAFVNISYHNFFKLRSNLLIKLFKSLLFYFDDYYFI